VRWGLTVGEPVRGGASSVAFHTGTPDGTPAVLKLSPDEAFAAEQAAVLRLFEPSGRVPRVLAAAGGAVLLTEIRPGTPVRDLPVPPGPAEFGEFLAALHGVPLPAADVVPHDLRAGTDDFLRRALRRLADPLVAAHLRGSDFDRAQAVRDRLLATGSRTALVHGDLHLANVLVGESGLVAIDPTASVGDPCFDAVDYVAAGAGRGDVEARLAGLAPFGYDPDRVLAWLRVAVPALVPPLVVAGQLAAAGELLELLRSG
jgi:streptomycin 6-kinase